MGEANFSEQLEALNSQFNSLLEDYANYYTLYQINPENAENENSYLQVSSNIQSINSEVLKISSNIETALNNLLENANNLSSQIEEEKSLQMQLKQNLGLIQPNSHTSNMLINDYKENYKEQYIKNITTFIGIFLSVYIIFKVYLIK